MPPGETGKLCSRIQPDKKGCHRTTKSIQNEKSFTHLSKESDHLKHQVRKYVRHKHRINANVRFLHKTERNSHIILFNRHIAGRLLLLVLCTKKVPKNLEGVC